MVNNEGGRGERERGQGIDKNKVQTDSDPLRNHSC